MTRLPTEHNLPAYGSYRPLSATEKEVNYSCSFSLEMKNGKTSLIESKGELLQKLEGRAKLQILMPLGSGKPSVKDSPRISKRSARPISLQNR
tara:strand:- start:8380 stop:8658 length:279 start_codon:yes stop_codon:yes gene_type:complete